MLYFKSPESWKLWDWPFLALVGLEELLPQRISQLPFAPPTHWSVQLQPSSSGDVLYVGSDHQSGIGRTDRNSEHYSTCLIKLSGATECLQLPQPLPFYSKMLPNVENLPQLANMFLQHLSHSLH
ncbi:Protein KTI12 [Galemys pyrenaicus]|uniref:Protein KTI12 n=1 Tax=Galemys pyrenaicus TaxID=202257 RepID=A0A8J6AW32_GALPY|nr:Protein KTI12 [Galemys pyrenaicus]